MRALLAVAMIALVGLTAAVVMLATDDDPGTSASPATQLSAPSQAGSIRYDGGPEEGTAEVSTSPPRVTQSQAFPGLASKANGAQADERHYDGPEEGTRGSGH
jgi:hypothetical protein